MAVRSVIDVSDTTQTALTSEWTTFDVSIDDGVTELTLNTGATGNLLGSNFWRELPELFHQLDRDPRVRVVILSAAGPHFSYGIDLKAMSDIFGSVVTEGGLADRRTEFRQAISDVQSTISAVADCSKPVIAAVQGWCIGGAVDLISATDIRYASRDARFSVREIKVAMVADLGSLQRLPGIIGDGHLRELALTGDDIDAARAQKIGLVNDVLGDHSSTVDHARAVARRIAQNAPLPVQGVKQILNHARQPSIQDGLTYVATWNSAFLPSNDLTEAITAVFDKRRPNFQGQ